VSAAQLETDLLDGLVSELEEVGADDLEMRLQLATARAFLASRKGTLAGVWPLFEPLVDVAGYAADPMVRSSFFIGAAYVRVSRADYRLALELIARALAVCDEFRLGDVKRGFCLCYQAAAEIGLRRFADAERTLAEMVRGEAGRTRSLVSEHRILRLKLALAKGDPAAALALADAEGPAAEAPSSAGEHAGLVALAAAATGDVDRARAEAGRAREVTASIEAHYHARFSELVGRAERDDPAGARRRAVDLLAEAAAAEMLDPLVVAYRVDPGLLGLLAADPFSLDVVRNVLAAAGDHVLARRAGVHVEPPEGGEELRGRLALLTPREREVLELVAEGLPNAEIARRLFISEKTAKVHVHHIFEKLGVGSRLQAALAAKELLPEAPSPEP
jgi:DNA-binding CsgD family transcriptional regulator